MAPSPMTVWSRECEVRHDEQHGAHRRQAEQAGDLPLGALGLGLVDVGRPPGVRGETRVLDRLVRLQGGQVVTVLPVVHVLLEVGHAACSSFCFVERVVWAAIQIAKPTIAPMPTTQANRPSLTGPRPPSVNPP